jgi:plastocyanin
MAIKLKHRPKRDSAETTRYLIVGVLVVAAFFGAYRFARASKASADPSAVALSSGAAATGPSTSGVLGGTAGASAATLEGGVQKISVDASQGGYNPSVIQLKAGVPTEITFGQASGCLGTVQSSDLGFQEDLSSGPKTVKIKALQPGTYGFACGMNMVQGQVVVQ